MDSFSVGNNETKYNKLFDNENEIIYRNQNNIKWNKQDKKFYHLLRI